MQEIFSKILKRREREILELETETQEQSLALEKSEPEAADRSYAHLLLGVLTVSDRCSQGLMVDTAGPAVTRLLRENLPDANFWAGLVRDDEGMIASTLRELSRKGAALILTVGGTGLGPRDRTPEATRQVIDREAPGLAEAMRAIGATQYPFSWLSRGIAGLAGKTIIVNLPGSERGATESLISILPLLQHGIEIAAGGQNHP
jgi:molybdenum cofactor synthesis domain-containing protein